MHHGLPAEDWDERLQARGGSFLQSRPWAAFQQELGREVVHAEGQGWQWLAGVRRSHGLNYLMCSYGPAADSPAGMKAAVSSLRRAAEELGLDFVRLEPQHHSPGKTLRDVGARHIADADPTYTRVVDLTLDEADLRSALDSGHRNRVNGTERRGISVRRGGEADFETFLEMLHDTAKRSGVTFYPDEYFQAMYKTLVEHQVAVLYVAEVEHQPVSAAFFYDWGNTRYYAHAGAFQELNRKLKVSVSLVWQGLMDAKAAGKTRFDLWGTAPEGDDKHHLASISHFKKGFGGELVEYAGTWDLPVNSQKYRLYQVYRKLRGRS